MAHIRLFAGAADAAGVTACDVDAADTDALREALGSAYGPDLTRVLPQCTLLVDGIAAVEKTSLSPETRVDVLPPFAGG